MKIKRGLAGIMLAGFAWVGLSRAQESGMMDPGSFAHQKIALERALEDKAQGVLNDMLGPGMAKVVVNLTLNPTFTESIKIDVPKSAAGGGSSYQWRDSKNSNYVLPGFIIQSDGTKNGQPSALPIGPMNYSRSFVPFTQMIEKMEAIILVDPRVPAERVEEVKSTLTRLLGITPERQDTLSVVTTSFMPPWKLSLLSPEKQFQMMLWIFVAVVGFLALLLVYKAAMSIAWAMSSMGAEMRQTQHSVSMAITPAVTKELPSSSDKDALELLSAEPGASSRSAANGVQAVNFSFLNAQNIGWAAEFLRNQPPRTICLVMASLDAEVATLLLERLPEDLRGDVLQQLGQPLMVSKEEKADVAKKMEEFLQTYLDTPGRLLQLFGDADPDMQKKMMDELRKTRPDLAQSLESSVVQIEDLAALPEDDRMVLVTGLPLETFALALRGSSEDIVRAFLKPLPRGLRAQLEQHIRLTGPQPISQVKKARKAVVVKFQELQKAGKINSPQSADKAQEQMV